MFRFKKPATKTYAAPAAATGLVDTITWTTNEPTLSYTYTVADGAAPTSTEIGIFMKSADTQINALIADVLALRTALLKIAVDDADLRDVLQEPN